MYVNLLHKLFRESLMLNSSLNSRSTPNPQSPPQTQPQPAQQPTHQPSNETLKRQMAKSLDLARMVLSKHKSIP